MGKKQLAAYQRRGDHVGLGKVKAVATLAPYLATGKEVKWLCAD